MGELLEEEVFIKFGGYQEINIGITLDVSFQHLTLVLVGIYYVTSSSKEI